MNFVSFHKKIIGYKQTDKQTSTAYILGKAKMRYYKCVLWPRSPMFYITPSYRGKNIYFIIIL